MNYSKEIIDFFKRHNMYKEKMFNYLQEKTYMFDYKNEDYRILSGFNYHFRKEDGSLKSFLITIPYDYDDITRLICIHDIVHGIVTYPYINTYYEPDNSEEMLPFLYELVYFNEHPSEELYEFLNKLDSCITEDSEEKYKLALKYRDFLYEHYTGNFNKMNRLSKLLVLKDSVFHK